MRKSKQHALAISTILLTVILAACTAVSGAATPTSVMPTLTVAAVPTITLVSTASSYNCGYIWARQRLPELDNQVQAALNSAGLDSIQVWTEAYGENCMDSLGQVQSFSAMETDFHLTVPVSSLTDLDSMGSQLEKALDVLDAFPPGKVPGPQPGYVGVLFTAGQDQLNLWFTVQDGINARQQGLHGAALLEALQKK